MVAVIKHVARLKQSPLLLPTVSSKAGTTNQGQQAKEDKDLMVSDKVREWNEVFKAAMLSALSMLVDCSTTENRKSIGAGAVSMWLVLCVAKSGETRRGTGAAARP